jgi:uncharacterized protein (DUF1684 family)
MFRSQPERAALAACALLALPALLGAPALLSAAPQFPASTTGSRLTTEAEHAAIRAWRTRRDDSLTSDTGWLTLTGLLWLKPGDNSFGRAASNALVLDNAALADTAGSFVLTGGKVRFVAHVGGGVTRDGQPVSAMDLVSDAHGEPTVLASGALRFFIIERSGNVGVRVRDLNNPHRLNFQGLTYFPVSSAWVFNARFEPYQPVHHIKITNILGMEEDDESPGAVVFTKNGRQWRLDTVLEDPRDQELFIMFADATSGHETYGAGRFLYIPLPANGTVVLDFNKAFNPPCALNDFATCPLPPFQNRLKLKVEAGEKTYAGRPEHKPG